jgi:hypothetical protein
MLAKIALGFLVTTVACSAYVLQDGFVHVSVDESTARGRHLHLVVPAELAPIAAHFIPRQRLDDARQDLRDILPALKLSAIELAKLPDTVLVEVRDRTQHILIAKSGDGLSIDKESPREHVRVWIPLHAIYDTAGVLESHLESE